MGYLTDNIPLGRNSAFCQDLYRFRLVVQPGSASDATISAIIKDELPDVEEWQYSGRRRCPVIPSRGKSRSIRRVIHPATWAQNSRLIRPFTEEVVYAFHTEAQRTQIEARLVQERFKFRIENEPT